eukprot:TRINITY_DN61397_c0_g1_i1.p1 TRINITY_DN61397_c0_g1~~TRINITY_DN61397_c0_g1_i1.p1  ORF type:complete len:359 (+),score=75.92 TRINITY_DN61397_c0_g1_i1:39-1115(+)
MPPKKSQKARSWPADTKIVFALKNPKAPRGAAFARYEAYKHAKTIQEAIDRGAWLGDLDFDSSRGHLQKCRQTRAATGAGRASAASTFTHVMSLGSRCLVAECLRDEGLRRYSGPFDWIYSSPEMIEHCIKDDFAAFMDKKQIVRAGGSFGHKLYGPMLKRAVVFPHHNPGSKDREDFMRRTARFKKVISSPKRKLLPLCTLVQSEANLALSRDVSGEEAVFKALRAKGCKNFEMLSVHVVSGKCSEANKRKKPVVKPLKQHLKVGQDILSSVELHCTGDCTGLRLKRKQDSKALGQCLVDKRDFDLDPDPLLAPQVLKKPAGAAAVKRKPAAADTVPGAAPVKMRRHAGGWRHAHMD